MLKVSKNAEISKFGLYIVSKLKNFKLSWLKMTSRLKFKNSLRQGETLNVNLSVKTL